TARMSTPRGTNMSAILRKTIVMVEGLARSPTGACTKANLNKIFVTVKVFICNRVAKNMSATLQKINATGGARAPPPMALMKENLFKINATWEDLHFLMVPSTKANLRRMFLMVEVHIYTPMDT